MIRWASWGAFILLTFSVAMADTITTRSGETHTGRVVAEDADSITLDVSGQAGIAMRRTVSRANIASITKDEAAAGPRYFEIPVMGTVGREITARGLGQALDAARLAHATHVVLLIDSHGGMISEMEKIIQVMQENKDLQTVAFVRNAHSAAAVIAGTCRTIVMHPMGQMGAAVPFFSDANGNVRELPRDVNEKLSSAVRALVRTAAGVGGHPSELFMGMVDPDIELYLSDSDGKAHVGEEKLANAKCIKSRGKILTMNAEEANSYGLASGTCKTMGDVGRHLGFAKWSSAGTGGWEIAQQQASTAQSDGNAEIDARQKEAIRALGSRATEILNQQRRQIQNEIDLTQQYLDKLETQFRNDTRVAGNASLRRAYERQREMLQARLEEWQQRLVTCRKQIDYVKNNLQ